MSEAINIKEGTGPFVLSIDIGTSGIRAAIYDGGGRELEGTAASVSRSFTFTADGGAETDGNELGGQTEDVLSRSIAAFGPGKIDAVSIATFWHALLGVDAGGHPVTPIYGWADTRAAGEAAKLREKFDERAVHLRTGCRFHAGYWPAKLRWLRTHRPDLTARVAQWISPGDYLMLRWCGRSTTSISMASATGLLDQRRGDWDGELLSDLSLDHSELPKLADDSEVIHFGPGCAGIWPQLVEARIFPAIGDGAANNLGTGCVTADQASLMIGTSGAMRVLWTGDPPEELPHGLWQYRADRRRVVVGGALSDGGGLFRWMTESLSLTGDRGAIEGELSGMEPDAHGLTVLPFWAGERSTGWNSAARGGIFGLTMETKPIDIVRAAMEAVAYRFAAIAEQLEQMTTPKFIFASGGALRESRGWTQILADVLGWPLQLTGVTEASGRGAALLALEQMEELSDLSGFAPRVTDTVTPDPHKHERYLRARERQQQLRDLLYGGET